MSVSLPSPLAPAPVPIRQRPTPAQWLGIVSITVFISTEIVTAAAAAVWGFGGLLGIGPSGLAALAALAGAPALYAVIKTAQLAFAAETDPQNN